MPEPVERLRGSSSGPLDSSRRCPCPRLWRRNRCCSSIPAIDPDHPALASALVPGYDFLTEQQGLPSEWDFLGGSLQPILDGSLQPILEGSLQPILDQSAGIVVLGQGELMMLDASIAPVVDASGRRHPRRAGAAAISSATAPWSPASSGWSRPGATIMPLRVFDSVGLGAPLRHHPRHLLRGRSRRRRDQHELQHAGAFGRAATGGAIRPQPRRRLRRRGRQPGREGSSLSRRL